MKADPGATSVAADLELARLGPDRDAGLWVCALPVPRRASTRLSLGGRSTFVKPLGQWHDVRAESPRRLLLFADGQNSAPPSLGLDPSAPAPCSTPPQAVDDTFACSANLELMWEGRQLTLSYGDASISLALGLRRGSEVHWWEACRLVTLAATPHCREIEMGGAIPVEPSTLDDFQGDAAYANRFLHRHNWLNGHIYARLHANGVCEFYVHHVNSKYVDEGGDFEDVAPMIGIRTGADAEELAAHCGEWDGSTVDLAVGGVRFDLSAAAPLATAEQPGRFDCDDGFLVWQPYMGMELYGGRPTTERLGDPYVCRAEERRVPRGMARTVRFSLSLSPTRSPVVARYQAPAWWYGHCEEFMPDALLPVSNSYDSVLEQCGEWLRRGIRRGGFEDGSAPRGMGRNGSTKRPEPGWEGEVPYTQFLLAWRNGSAEDHDLALRAAYCFADVYIDHAAKSVRMHGFPPQAFSLPMNRVLGPLAAYLETGDPYLLNEGRAVVDASYGKHLNSWPRLAVGRDACFIRGAVFLYRYFGDPHYREVARECVLDVAQSQRADGSFGDQGGGARLHQIGGYITKPWMGCMAIGPCIDYLELCPDDEEVLDCVKRYADWLLAARLDRDGVQSWTYQYDYHGQGRHYNITSSTWRPLPSRRLWHLDYLARILMYCTVRFGDPAYFDAWAESFRGRNGKAPGGDHSVAQSLQFLPWLQAKLWNARLTADGVEAKPLHLGRRTPRKGAVHTPAGLVPMAWASSCKVKANGGVVVTPTAFSKTGTVHAAKPS